MHLGGSTPAVLEIGPAVVRELSRPDAARRHGALAESALAGIDDSVVLVGDRPVCVDDLWRSLIRSVLGGRRGSVVVVHPSRWSPERIERVRAAAAAVARRVAVTARGEWLQGRTDAAVVVEVDAEFVAVRSARAVAVFRRIPDALADAGVDAGVDAVVDAVRDAITGDPGSRTGTVVIDAPRGADSTAATAIRHAVLDNGLPAHRVALTTGLIGAQPGRGGGRDRPRVRAGLAAALLVAVGVAAGLSGNPTRPHDPPVGAGGTVSTTVSTRVGSTVNTLVEGRVAVQVPIGWTEQRITGGPGSRRVQVTSPDDPTLALHITQSFTPEVTLAETVESLRRAIANQPPGVFVDFTAQASVAGRAAVTYRELRPARVIGWSVLQEGSTRISVGCQSRPGGEDGIRTACDQAVRSARELGGTEQGG